MPEPRDTVRLLAGASLDDASNDDLDALLAEEGGIVKLAAADLLELRASRLLSVQSDDISVDGSKQAASLRAQAASLREQHYAHGGDFFFDTARIAPADRRHLHGSGDYPSLAFAWDEVI